MAQQALALWLLLSLVCVLKEANTIALSELDDTIKQDLFCIYTHTALTERKVLRVPVTTEDVKFYLFTKNNPENFVKLNSSNPTELNNTNAKIVFIIHGWTESRQVDWYEDLKNSFLKRDSSYYVVQVDWSKISLQGYLLSSYSTKDVGAIIGKFIVDLNKNYSIPLANFLVVGHSLGGQISGFVGKKVIELKNQKLPRIVALDPAGPFFTDRPEEERLNKNDAEIVHVIHTDGGTFGFLAPCGTIDFFPNGGSSQPGCISITLTDPASIVEPIMCDHHRSWQYFIEAVRKPDEFESTKCRDWVTYSARILCDDEDQVAMGDLTDKKIGKFFLTTNDEPPFYKQSNVIERLLPKIRL